MPERSWNVLTDPWLETIGMDATVSSCSPLQALRNSNEIKCISAGSPLDLFAAHRFILTLLYWKAKVAGGITKLREALRNGIIPATIIRAISDESQQFELFDPIIPFLQDPSLSNLRKKDDFKSAGSFFAEFATGTNVAHFHHGDDKKMCLCLRCTTIGLMRVIPLTQSGGRGLHPSVHNAPPIVSFAVGTNLVETLGLNLVPLKGVSGTVQWTGHFIPGDKKNAIPYLEAFTWNPRRIHLPTPIDIDECWGCGAKNVKGVGQIIYKGNPDTQANKKNNNNIPFIWQDPGAFYIPESDDNVNTSKKKKKVKDPFSTTKSSNEKSAAVGKDVNILCNDKNLPRTIIGEVNSDHKDWLLIVPCTEASNNKTYDHRSIKVKSFEPDEIHKHIPKEKDKILNGLNGWVEPKPKSDSLRSAVKFMQATSQLLNQADWAVLANAAFQNMNESPAAFDLFVGIYWGLRERKGIRGLPSKNVAWLTLKLMASVPADFRTIKPDADFTPLDDLKKKQIKRVSIGQKTKLVQYPQALPTGNRLEASLREILAKNVKSRTPRQINWAGFCHALDQLLS